MSNMDWRKARPGRGKKGKTGGSLLVPPVSDTPTLADIGVDELAAIPKAKGTRGTLRGGKPGKRGKRGNIPGGSLSVPPGNDMPTLADIGVDKKDAARARALSGIPLGDRECRWQR